HWFRFFSELLSGATELAASIKAEGIQFRFFSELLSGATCGENTETHSRTSFASSANSYLVQRSGPCAHARGYAVSLLQRTLIWCNARAEIVFLEWLEFRFFSELLSGATVKSATPSAADVYHISGECGPSLSSFLTDLCAGRPLSPCGLSREHNAESPSSLAHSRANLA